MRSYGTDPQVWGGDPACEHVWGAWEEHRSVREPEAVQGKTRTTDRVWGDDPTRRFDGNHQKHVAGAFCRRCSAWFGELGNEPSIALYVAHLVEVCRAVRRVLRPDGLFFLNLGDSFARNPAKGQHRPGQSGKQAGCYDTGAGRAGACLSDGLKEKDLLLVPARAAIALVEDGWWLRNDIIWHKCLSGGIWLYARTPAAVGPAQLSDLVTRDPETIELWNGQRWTRVVSWTPVERPDETFEIELRSGERIGCTPEHRWPTERGLVRSDELVVGDVLNTCRLPGPEVADASVGWGLDDEVVGYFVGSYLADGSRSGVAIQVATNPSKRDKVERLRKFAERYHGTLTTTETDTRVDVRLYGPALVGILDTYLAGQTAHGKHLDSRCWQRSDRFLAALLEGYLSGDGYLDPRGFWRVGFCDNDRWSVDLRTLCARLGYGLKLRRSSTTFQGREFPGWQGRLRMKRSGHHNAREDGEIVEVRRSRARQFWDVEVADDPHLFALASGVLTHNSNAKPESIRDRFTVDYEHVFMLAKSSRYHFDQEGVREPHQTSKVDRTVRHKRLDTREQAHAKAVGEVTHAMRDSHGGLGFAAGGRNRRSVWSITTKPFKGSHFAVWPPDLVEILLRAGTSEGGCCAKCGTPRKRILQKGEPNREWQIASGGSKEDGTYSGVAQKEFEGTGAEDASAVKARILEGMRPKLTLGYEWGCACQPQVRTEFPEPRHPRKRAQRAAWPGRRERISAQLAADPAGVAPCRALDPFGGSGTTGVVAHQLGIDCTLIELREEYGEIARARCAAAGIELVAGDGLAELRVLETASLPPLPPEDHGEDLEEVFEEDAGWLDEHVVPAFPWARRARELEVAA